MKKLIAIVLLVAMIMSMVPQAFAADIAEGVGPEIIMQPEDCEVNQVKNTS